MVPEIGVGGCGRANMEEKFAILRTLREQGVTEEEAEAIVCAMSRGTKPKAEPKVTARD